MLNLGKERRKESPCKPPHFCTQRTLLPLPRFNGALPVTTIAELLTQTTVWMRPS